MIRYGNRKSPLFATTLVIALIGSGTAAADCQSGDTRRSVNFSDIPPAASVAESQNLLQARKDRVISAFAGETPLPNDCRQPDNSFPDLLQNQLDSRSDVELITTRAVAKILSGQHDPALEQILLAANLKPFSRPGTSNVGGVKLQGVTICEPWSGDYDFSLIDLLNLYFVARDRDPDSLYFSQAARAALRDKLLTVRGKITETYRLDYCKVLGVKFVIDVEDTENHILMTSIARYLTNQIMYERTGGAEYDNVQLGNRTWMLNHLAKLTREHFYEYNSKPYQKYTIGALTLLHSYSDDQAVRTGAKNLLDLISAWSAVQSNNMRSFTPFRRQPVYYNNTEARQASGEFERLALLVGNYHSPGQGQGAGNVAFSIDHKSFFAINSSYRMDPVILDLAIRRDPASRYFVGMHAAAEIYASSPNALISAGGSSAVAEIPEINFRLTPGVLLDSVVHDVLGALVAPILEGERGLAAPTIIIPTRETSTSWEDMVRFEGNRDLKAATEGENLCVAPGFACGLQLKLGRRLDGLASVCWTASSKIPGMRFYNLNQDSSCPQYGLHLAVYQQPCDTSSCAGRADNYGFVEVAEAGTRTFAEFRSRVETANNTTRFSSSGVHAYNTLAGQIKFEIAPPAGQASIVEVHGVSYGRDYRNWPRARSQTLQSTVPGLVTVDSIPLQKRLILDSTIPLQPKNVSGGLPYLISFGAVGGNGGKYFNDGPLVIAGDTVKWIAVDVALANIEGVSMGWSNGLTVSHGATASDVRLALGNHEYIQEIKACTGVLANINFLRIKTNTGRSISAGPGTCLLGSSRTFTANPGQQIIALHGSASHGTSNVLDKVGVIMTPRL